LLQAFTEGDPSVAYATAIQLIESHRVVFEEAARLRFRANFGTRTCDTCDGLRAGPGVASTCFQIRQCYYRSLKETDVSAKRLAVVEAFEKRPLKP
jgi:hypothetical protein